MRIERAARRGGGTTVAVAVSALATLGLGGSPNVCPAMQTTTISSDPAAHNGVGFTRIEGPFAQPGDAWIAARALVDVAEEFEFPLEVIGDFVVPPADGPPSRDFQTLHLDFGLPLVPTVPAEVARFTALHVPVGAPATKAVTRLVPLRSLLDGSSCPDGEELIRRFAAYGHSHGAWNDDAGYLEGSLARIIEAALGQTPVLPSVKSTPGFLCGTEFGTLADEVEFFAARGLRLDEVEIGICLRPGELLVFDNLMLAHGRRGTRQAGELHQRVFGHSGSARAPADRRPRPRTRLFNGTGRCRALKPDRRCVRAGCPIEGQATARASHSADGSG